MLGYVAAEEKPNERTARHIVSTVLGVPVERYDDGSRNGMVDAVIAFPDRQGALEVVADHDATFNALWNALQRIDHKTYFDGLAWGWSVTLYHHARLHQVLQELPGLLRDMEAGQVGDLSTAYYWPGWYERSEARWVYWRLAGLSPASTAGVVSA